MICKKIIMIQKLKGKNRIWISYTNTQNSYLHDEQWKKPTVEEANSGFCKNWPSDFLQVDDPSHQQYFNGTLVNIIYLSYKIIIIWCIYLFINCILQLDRAHVYIHFFFLVLQLDRARRKITTWWKERFHLFEQIITLLIRKIPSRDWIIQSNICFLNLVKERLIPCFLNW